MQGVSKIFFEKNVDFKRIFPLFFTKGSQEFLFPCPQPNRLLSEIFLPSRPAAPALPGKFKLKGEILTPPEMGASRAAQLGCAAQTVGEPAFKKENPSLRGGPLRPKALRLLLFSPYACETSLQAAPPLKGQGGFAGFFCLIMPHTAGRYSFLSQNLASFSRRRGLPKVFSDSPSQRPGTFFPLLLQQTAGGAALVRGSGGIPPVSGPSEKVSAVFGTAPPPLSVLPERATLLPPSPPL